MFRATLLMSECSRAVCSGSQALHRGIEVT